MSRILPVAAILGLLVAVQPTAHATPIEFDPAAQAVDLGDQVSVDIVVTPDLGVQIGAYDFIIDFDDSILSVASVVFGTALGGPFGSIESDLSFGGGAHNLFGISLLPLLPQDGSPFVLATLVFDTLMTGTSGLSFSPNTPDPFGGPAGFLGDATGIFLVATEPGTGSITVNDPPVAVPEPGSWTLLLAGLLIMTAGVRRRAK